jgi:hypothetical protein
MSLTWISQLNSWRTGLGLGQKDRLHIVIADHQENLQKFTRSYCPPGSIKELTLVLEPSSGHVSWRRFH